MTTLDLYGIVVFAVLVLLFYGVRSIPLYVALALAIVGGFAAVTSGSTATVGWPTWLVMLSGLLLCAFGLLIVRTMLIRSVSLHLLRSIDSGHADTFNEDIATRLSDMRALSLIRARDGDEHTLTSVGRLIAGGVAALYTLFRIQA